MSKEEVKTKVPVKMVCEVGDYIVNNDSVFLLIQSVINDGLGNMYGYLNCKTNKMNWMSQYELDDDDFRKEKPDFERYQKLKAGDILQVGDSKNNAYVTVLSRVGNAVLLSAVPDKELLGQMKMMQHVVKRVSEQLGEDAPEFGLDTATEKRLKKRASQLHSSKIAGDWMSIEKLCLMNWPWISEEN